MDREAMKRRAAERAVERVEDGSVVGLGSGSTAAFAIRALGERTEKGLSVRGIPTSIQSRVLAIESGIDVVALDQVERVDVAIDGADKIAGADLIKGGGASHALEKVVDAAAEEFLVVADETKLANRLEDPVPVEVLPDARTTVADSVRRLDGTPELREAERKSGPVVTDNGNLVLDCSFGPIDDPATLAAELAAIPGTVEHGLFVAMADAIYVGTDSGVDVLETF